MCELSGVCSTYRGRRDAYRVSVRKPEVKPFGKSRCRWENYFKMDLQVEKHGLNLSGSG
jgi:hypothetical protein